MSDFNIELAENSTSVCLRFPCRDENGALVTGLSYLTSGLRIRIIASLSSYAVTYPGGAGGSVEDITTAGTYQAPSAFKCRFKETSIPGIYELQLGDSAYTEGELYIVVEELSSIVSTVIRVGLYASKNAAEAVWATSSKVVSSVTAGVTLTTSERSSVGDAVAAKVLVNPTAKLTTNSSGQVTVCTIISNAITADVIANGAIDAAAIADGSITNSKFGTGAISSTTLASDAITAASVASDVSDEVAAKILATPSQKITTSPSGEVYLRSAERQYIAEALLDHIISAHTGTGTFGALMNSLSGKLPAGAISDLTTGTTVDGVSVINVLKLVQSLVRGKYALNTPSAGQITWYANDNSTPICITEIDTDGRTRIL